jgi:hypothetical protein
MRTVAATRLARTGAYERQGDEPIEIAGELRRETVKAVLVFDGDIEAWLPKSLVEDLGDGTWMVPMWLARKEGLV